MSDPSGPSSILAGLSDQLAELVSRVAPAVVAVSGAGDDPASGSGFLIDDQGHVVTNYHVANGLLPPIRVSLHGGEQRTAAVLGSDTITDLALLQMDGTAPHHLDLREAPARLGELCIGIGSPFGLYPESVAMGVVSGLARRIVQENSPRPIENAIQTDVAINPGNSGGPLVDAGGLVIGVNKGVDSRGTGIGFAVPAETVRWVVPELRDHGEVVRAALGCTVVRHAVEVNGSPSPGLKVTRVVRQADGGLQIDDVILRIGSDVVDEVSDLYRILTKDLIGKATNVQVLRDGAVRDLTVTPTRLGASAG